MGNRKAPQEGLSSFLAERGGFEPPVGYEPTHAFQACDLNHSSISPDGSTWEPHEAAYYSKYSQQYKADNGVGRAGRTHMVLNVWMASHPPYDARLSGSVMFRSGQPVDIKNARPSPE